MTAVRLIESSGSAGTIQFSNGYGGFDGSSKLQYLTSSNDIILSGNFVSTGTISIGASEDASYTDGLFTDFTKLTPIGTAIDRFNEVLKALAPSPAPSLDNIDCSDSGQSGKLSFGSSNAISGYTNVSSVGNLSAVDVNGTYSVTSVSNDLRRGLFNGGTTINGKLNSDVSADSPNYGNYAFGDGKTGFAILELNGSNILSASLSESNNQIVTSSAGGSSFTIEAALPAHFADGTELDVFMHRSGTYSISTSDQRNGLNYARVIHRKASSMSDSSSDVNTNYAEWVNDNDSNSLSAAGSVLDSLSMTGLFYLSGVKYYTGGSAEYRVRVSNAYRNVYSTSNITFNGTRCSVNSKTFPSINTGAGEDETKTLHLTGSTSITSDPILNQSISVSVNVPHPLKSNLSSAGSESISNILLYNLSNTSTVTSETFRRETYRLISGNYSSQSDVTNSDNTWSSIVHMSGSNTGYVDGLMFYNSRLYSPSQGANSGNFSTISNGPANNVNYSGITSGERTFYRYFQNNSSGSKTGFSITINGSGTIVSSGVSLNTSRIKVFIKLPATNGGQSTGWMDLATPFSTGETGDNDGCLEGSFDSSLNATNTVTFGSVFVADNEYIMIKVVADGSFTGYVNTISISWS